MTQFTVENVKIYPIENQKFLYFLNQTKHRFTVRATPPNYPLEKIKRSLATGYCLRLQVPGMPDDWDFVLAVLEPDECLRVRTVSFCLDKKLRKRVESVKFNCLFSRPCTRRSRLWTVLQRRLPVKSMSNVDMHKIPATRLRCWAVTAHVTLANNKLFCN